MQVMAHHTHEPDPETPEKAKRRNFTDAQKLKILELLDKTEEGKKGALMRSMGVYSSSVTTLHAISLPTPFTASQRVLEVYTLSSSES
jgi:hypothetical protein